MDTIGIPDIRTNDIASMSKLTAQAHELEAKMKGINKESKLYKVSQDFEALFIKQMLNVMRKTVHKEGILEGGFAEEIFEDMLYDEYAKKMAENANLGIADMIYNQYSRYTEE